MPTAVELNSSDKGPRENEQPETSEDNGDEALCVCGRAPPTLVVRTEGADQRGRKGDQRRSEEDRRAENEERHERHGLDAILIDPRPQRLYT